jgi:hypothetical protein
MQDTHPEKILSSKIFLKYILEIFHPKVHLYRCFFKGKRDTACSKPVELNPVKSKFGRRRPLPRAKVESASRGPESAAWMKPATCGTCP